MAAGGYGGTEHTQLYREVVGARTPGITLSAISAPYLCRPAGLSEMRCELGRKNAEKREETIKVEGREGKGREEKKRVQCGTPSNLQY